MKNTDTAAHRGYDADKKVSGTKRHIAVDSQGLSHAIVVITANATDRKGALAALGRSKPSLSRVQSLPCDSSYAGRPFAQGVRDILARPRSGPPKRDPLGLRGAGQKDGEQGLNSQN